MPKTIETKVFTYEELSDEAKQKASEWYLDGNYLIGEDAWEQIKGDASQVGLKIISLDKHRENKGAFKTSAPEVAETIVAQHGDTCQTHKTAKLYLKELADLGERPSDTEEEADDSYWEDNREEMDKEFLGSLLCDYYHMLEREIEYQESEEVISEAITANEYTFTEDGKRFG